MKTLFYADGFTTKTDGTKCVVVVCRIGGEQFLIPHADFLAGKYDEVFGWDNAEKETITGVIRKLQEKHYEDFYPNSHLIIGLREENELIEAIISLLRHDYCLED